MLISKVNCGGEIMLSNGYHDDDNGHEFRTKIMMQ